jgi:hypothetical protein
MLGAVEPPNSTASSAGWNGLSTGAVRVEIKLDR